jgi:hypothetical protein
MGALAALLLVPGSGIRAQLVESFDDIEYWVGLGASRSALVLQWNDGEVPASLAWGYRWSGAVSGIDLLVAVAGTTVIREPFGGDIIETRTGADSRLQLTLERYGFGDIIYAVEFQGETVLRTSADWSSGYWAYSLFAGNFDYFIWDEEEEVSLGPFEYHAAGDPRYAEVDWFASQIGASDRLLVDGSWDAWSFAAGFASVPIAPPEAVAVPEPGVVWLVALGLGAAWLEGRRRGKTRV